MIYSTKIKKGIQKIQEVQLEFTRRFPPKNHNKNVYMTRASQDLSMGVFACQVELLAKQNKKNLVGTKLDVFA